MSIVLRKRPPSNSASSASHSPASSSGGVIAWPASSSWARSASQSRASTRFMPLRRRSARICEANLECLQLGQADQVGELVEPHRRLVGAEHLLHRAGGGEQR